MDESYCIDNLLEKGSCMRCEVVLKSISHLYVVERLSVFSQLGDDVEDFLATSRSVLLNLGLASSHETQDVRVVEALLASRDLSSESSFC